MRPLARFRIHRFRFARDRVIGDAHVWADTNNVGALELEDAEGNVGLGFFDSLFVPLPPRAWLIDLFERVAWPLLAGSAPEAALHRVPDRRGGHRAALPFGLADAIDTALWDLAAKRAGQPLWAYLGGTRGDALAYASGLDFPLDDNAAHAWYAAAARAGHTAFKVKVGASDPARDLDRLSLVRDAVGPEARLMIDANEAWTPHLACTRVTAFADAGFTFGWVEDPIQRDDFAGLCSLRGRLSGAKLNAGEYLPTSARLALLASGAVDVLPLHDNISDGLVLARAALGRVAVALGNTLMDVGSHLAAALPHCLVVEDSRLNTTDLLACPIPVIDGRFRLFDTPGHGLQLGPDASLHREDA